MWCPGALGPSVCPDTPCLASLPEAVMPKPTDLPPCGLRWTRCLNASCQLHLPHRGCALGTEPVCPLPGGGGTTALKWGAIAGPRTMLCQQQPGDRRAAHGDLSLLVRMWLPPAPTHGETQIVSSLQTICTGAITARHSRPLSERPHGWQ